jgi:hypothetical protein
VAVAAAFSYGDQSSHEGHDIAPGFSPAWPGKDKQPIPHDGIGIEARPPALLQLV